MEVQNIYPQKKEIFKNIEKVSVPNLNGKVQILYNHTEAFFFVKKGIIILTTKKNNIKIEASDAEIYIKNNIVKIIN